MQSPAGLHDRQTDRSTQETREAADPENPLSSSEVICIKPLNLSCKEAGGGSGAQTSGRRSRMDLNDKALCLFLFNINIISQLCKNTQNCVLII